jgi:hypothetical protein
MSSSLPSSHIRRTEATGIEDLEFMKSNGFTEPLRSDRTSAEETTRLWDDPSTVSISDFDASVFVWPCLLIKATKLEGIRKSDALYVHRRHTWIVGAQGQSNALC